MHIEFLVEEMSAEAALRNLVPKIIGVDHSFAVHAHNGKPDLLAKLPGRLAGYRHWLPQDWRVVVLLDADDADCFALKAHMEEIARIAGLITKSNANEAIFQVLNRVVVRELESWFLGDTAALRTAYPRVDANLGRRSKYRDPDAITGGTWEELERALQRAGYASGGLEKIATARAVSARMDPARNRSHSFQVFRQGLLALID